MNVIIRAGCYYIERSVQDRNWLPDGSADGLRSGPDWCAKERMGVGGGDCIMGSMGVMLGVMSSVTMFVVMASVMTMMTSGPVTEGEADKCCYEDDTQHVDTVTVRT